MMNKISVFGSTGFIGGNFCKLYEDEVVTIPRQQRSPATSDILYLISTTDNYNVYSDPFIDIDTNLKVLIETLEACKKRKAAGEEIIFNFVSSWFVYGKTEDLPASEDSFCDPSGFYSITKYAAERLLVSYCETFDLKYRIFRLSNVLGEGDPGVSNKKNAVQLMIQKLCLGEEINLYHNGDVIRDYLYVDDVSRAMLHCIRQAPVNEIINIGSGHPYKIGDLMNYAKEKTNSKSKINSIEPPEFHKIVQIRNMFLDTKKINSLGFQPVYSIEEILDKIIKQYNGEGI